MKAIVAVAILCAMALNLAAGSDQKPSTISDARAAIEKNMSTPLGKAYDKQLGQDLMQHYADSMRHCKQTAGEAEESFWINEARAGWLRKRTIALAGDKDRTV
jgi:hypothetical protein